MKYKAFDKVIYCGEETQIIGINSLEKDIKYAVTVGDDRTVEWAFEFELSPLEPEQLRRREQFFTDSSLTWLITRHITQIKTLKQSI